MPINDQLLIPDWPAPSSIGAVSSTRVGGVSKPPHNGFNMALHVADAEPAVQINRQRLLDQCQSLEAIQWLDQVHGNTCLELNKVVSGVNPAADASYTCQRGLACAVMTADCLPVLFCDRAGGQVAAAHAGWRGLAAGVLENTVAQFSGKSDQIMAWLGPAISQEYFEVGPEVREAFLALATNQGHRQAIAETFFASANTKHRHHYYVDLYQLARLQLQKVGITAIFGGNYCTYADHLRFYSYRRDNKTGRMVSLIYIKS